MNKFFLKTLALTLCAALAFSCAVGCFAEAGTTAASEEGTTNIGTADSDGSGTLTAADARKIALAAAGKADKISVKDGDFNMDEKVTVEDAKIVLRAAAGIAPLEKADPSDTLEMNGVGMYDRVLSASGISCSAAEYNYYYRSLYMSYAQQSYYYDYSYGEGYGAALTGFDYKKAPDEQYLPNSAGKKVTFAEYFSDLAAGTIEQYSYYAAEAEKLGITLDEEDLDYLSENLQNVSESAAANGMTAEELLEQQYGAGMNMYIFTKVIKQQLLARSYQEYVENDISAKITDEQIENQYKKSPSDYDTASLRAFRLAFSDSDKDAVKKKAEQFMKGVTDEASFVKLAAETDPENFAEDGRSKVPNADIDTIENALGEDAAKWIFDSARKAGEKKIVEVEGYFYVIFVVAPAGRNEDKLPSVRHILISFDDSEEAAEEGATDAEGNKIPTKEEAYKLCEKYLREYKKNGKNEEAFAALAEKYSEDTASLESGGQGGEGGLYADITKGAFVEEFENWAYDAERQIGDTGIIESVHGYHIMYFCGRAEEEAWKAEIRKELAEDETEQFMDSLADKYTGSAVIDKAAKAAADSFILNDIKAGA